MLMFCQTSSRLVLSLDHPEGINSQGIAEGKVGRVGGGGAMCGVPVCTWLDLQYIDPCCWVVLTLGGGSILARPFCITQERLLVMYGY